MSLKKLLSTFSNYKIQKKSDTKKKIVIASLIGGVIGGVTAMFTTKKNGKENRQMVAKQAKKAYDHSQQSLEEFKTQLDQISTNAKQHTEGLGKEAMSNLTSTIDTAKKAIKTKLNDALSSNDSEPEIKKK
jgi:gas vesicle protein